MAQQVGMGIWPCRLPPWWSPDMCWCCRSLESERVGQWGWASSSRAFTKLVIAIKWWCWCWVAKAQPSPRLTLSKSKALTRSDMCSRRQVEISSIQDIVILAGSVEEMVGLLVLTLYPFACSHFSVGSRINHCSMFSIISFQRQHTEKQNCMMLLGSLAKRTLKE